MGFSFVKPTVDLGDVPPDDVKRLVIESILVGPPIIYSFKHYCWLTGKPVPLRRNGETNDQYVKTHWRHLVRAAKTYVFPSEASTTVIDLPK